MSNIPLLFITIDSLGPEVLEKAETPFLDSIAETGSRVIDMRSCFPTLTTPMMSTILTGVFPEKHKIFSNMVLNKEEKKVEGVLRDLKSPSITDFLHKNNYNILSIQHFMLERREGVKHVQVNGNKPEEIRKTLEREMEEKSFDAIFCLYQSLDSVGHRYGPIHPKTIRELEKTDKELQLISDYLMDKLGEFVAVISSDHSMTLANNPTDLRISAVARVLELKVEMGKVEQKVSDNADILMLRFPTVPIYTLTEKAKEKLGLLVDMLKKFKAIDKVYTKEDMQNMHNPEYADLSFCFKKGYSTGLKSRRPGSFFGYHGTYHEEPSIFMFRGIDDANKTIEKGSLVDITPTTLDLLNIETTKYFDGKSLKK
ncbi:MAG: alkaline phosphatase family protein [Thermotogota bacterium]|nr:alkaline phosphatase family protein [Thermotogota bacterium]